MLVLKKIKLKIYLAANDKYMEMIAISLPGGLGIFAIGLSSFESFLYGIVVTYEKCYFHHKHCFEHMDLY